MYLIRGCVVWEKNDVLPPPHHLLLPEKKKKEREKYPMLQLKRKLHKYRLFYLKNLDLDFKKKSLGIPLLRGHQSAYLREASSFLNDFRACRGGWDQQQPSRLPAERRVNLCTSKETLADP
jgi:hypothetical protein